MVILVIIIISVLKNTRRFHSHDYCINKVLDNLQLNKIYWVILLNNKTNLLLFNSYLFDNIETTDIINIF